LAMVTAEREKLNVPAMRSSPNTNSGKIGQWN
jgi:hypothetical protein